MSIFTNNLTIEKFNLICRTCSIEGELTPLYENTYLLEMLKSCTQVEFNINDELPSQICATCIKELNQAYLFSNKCKIVDSALRACLAINKSVKKDYNDTHNIEEIPMNDCIKEEIETNVEEPYLERITCDDCFISFESYNDLEIHKNQMHFYITNQIKEETNNSTEIILQSGNKRGRPRKDDVSIKPPAVPKQIDYLCNICHKTFSKKHHLKNHRRTHSGEKPYICNICGKLFNQLSNLKKHRRIHTGEKPFICNICKRAFTQSSNLNKHIELVHKDN